MSDDLYFTRLRWSGSVRRGVAKLHGMRVELTTPPDLGTGAVAELDYAPEMGCREIRRTPVDRWEQMTTDEIGRADEMLRALCGEGT